MVHFEEAAKDLLSSGWADRVADTVVLGKCLDFMKIVTEVDVPFVCVTSGEIEFPMQTAQLEQTLVTPLSFLRSLLTDLRNQARCEIARVEQVVDICQAKPERQHQRFPMLVILLANLGQSRVRVLPQPRRERKGFEAVGWRIAKILFQCTAVLARPGFVECRLDHGEKIPPVGCKYKQRIGKDIRGRDAGEAQILRGSCRHKAFSK